jgi:anti-sigma B factor antagonist
MKFKVTQQDAVSVISLQGNVMGGPDATSLNSHLHDLVAAKKTQVVLDLAGVEFMNSSGLGMLIGGASTLKNAGGKLKLANASEKILALIKITKLSPVFEHYDSVMAAIASFTK